jgi:hypothetical protein
VIEAVLRVERTADLLDINLITDSVTSIFKGMSFQRFFPEVLGAIEFKDPIVET